MKRLLVLTLALSGSARAVEFNLNIGALEVVLVPTVAHAGFYPFVGVGLAVPLTERLTFLASLSLEASFEMRRGGLVAVATLDWRATSRLGVDFNLAFIHDQPGLQFTSAEFFVGAGPGVSVFLGRWALSPFVSLFAGLVTPGLSVVPGLNVSYTF
jgi:hypothetical protein